MVDNWTGDWTGDSPSIVLELPADAPAADLLEPILPVDVRVYDKRGNYLGSLIVWLSNGRLSALEYAWITDTMPPSLPEVEMLRVSQR